MTHQYYSIVIETEPSGAFSAYVPGLPVYAAADTLLEAESAIRDVLSAYLEAHPEPAPSVFLRMAKVALTSSAEVSITGIGAILGRASSKRKAKSSRANGRLGGRPRKLVAAKA